MPKVVKEKKSTISITNAVVSTFFSLIPIGIIALISKKNPNVWSTPYAVFCIWMLCVNTFYAIFNGIIAYLHKVSWEIITIISVIFTVGILVYSYINPANGLMLHIATGCLFYFMIYQIGDTYLSDNLYLRIVIPLFNLIAGLISVLWFVTAGYGNVLHYIVASIFIFIYIIVCIVSTVNFFNLGGTRYITDKIVTYTEETEEEKYAKEREKLRVKNEKLQAKVQKWNEKKAKKEAHDNDPKVIARRKKKEKFRKELKEDFKAIGRGVFGGLGALVPRFGRAPIGSKDWDAYKWGEYIIDRIKSSGAAKYGTFSSSNSSFRNKVEISISFHLYYNSHSFDYQQAKDLMHNAFHSAKKHCPYNIVCHWDI